MSDAYLESETPAQTAALNQTLQGKERALIPVLVSACDVGPLLAPVIAIDLTEVDEDEARHRLLSGISERPVRAKRGDFPGAARTGSGSPARIRRYGNFAGIAPIPISPGGTTCWLNCSVACGPGVRPRPRR